MTLWACRDFKQLWQIASDERNFFHPTRHVQEADHGNDLASPVVRKVLKLVHDDRFADAVRCMKSLGNAVCDKSTADALQNLHPHSNPPAVVPPVDSTPFQINQANFRKLIYKFKKTVAPGLSGLRISHIIQLSSGAPDLQLTQLFTQIINLMLAGKVPQEAGKFLFGASLSALNKKNGGIRPIAAGDVLRRIAGKAVCATFSGSFCELFGKNQFGVGVKGGMEVICHSMRILLNEHREDKDFFVFKVDFKNAF
jgi:hypothetical protein